MTFRAAGIDVLLGICLATAVARGTPRPTGRENGTPLSKAPSASATRPVTQRDIAAVLLAIKDEIYAGGCAPAFMDIGKAVGRGGQVHKINVYFSPSFHDGMAWAIYKFWPFGEVYRMYWVDKSGLAHLSGHPAWDFPSTEPSYLTVYMGDRQLCHLKSTWRRITLDIKISPNAERIREAKQRQAKRGGDVNFCRGRWHP